jgi:hypothetical protein
VRIRRAEQWTKLCLHAGKPDQARDHLNVATTMFRDMDMTYWLETAAEIQAL